MNLQHKPFSRRATVLVLTTAHYDSPIFSHPPPTRGYSALWYIPVHGCLYWGEYLGY